MKKIAIIGCGGFASYVAEIIVSTGQYEVVGFIGKKGDPRVDYIDDNMDAVKSDGINFLANGIGNLCVNNNAIIKLLKEYMNYGFVFPSVVHPSAEVSKSSSIGEGSMIMENAVVKSNSVIGKFCVINSLSVVSHDCEVGNYTHLSLGSKIGGGVAIGDNVLLGINSCVNPQITINSNSVIGSGAVIVKNIKKNSVVVGNPGRIIKNLDSN